jgi:hypothetical protein
MAGGTDVGLPVVQRFGSTEHVDIGKGSTWAGESVDIDLGGGEKLTYPQMIALAGDLFESVTQMKKLAETPAGQDELKFARWWKLDGNPGTKPALSDAGAEKRVKDRYYDLAGKNISHFSAGGTAMASYRLSHEAAMQEAFLYGATGLSEHWESAKLEEAFGQHYLTDMFSAGHVRTPRADIKTWYDARYAWVTAAFVRRLAGLIADSLHTHASDSHPPVMDDKGNPVPAELPAEALVWIGTWGSSTAEMVVAQVNEQFGAAVRVFSLGDLVSLAFHDEDSRTGLVVMSDVDAGGNPVPGGYVWPELDYGDGKLSSSPLTLQMVTAAVNESISELDLASQAGLAVTHGASRPLAEIQAAAVATRTLYAPFKAEGYVPRALPDEYSVAGAPVQIPRVEPTVNERMEWHWGSMNEKMRNALDILVKGYVADEIERSAGASPRIKDGRHLHTEKAIPEAAAVLRTQGVGLVEEVVGSPCG